MPLTREFFDAVLQLDKNWSMGVELLSPFIYSLIRCTKPRSALEVGAGYSSPFILQALADNLAEHRDRQDALRGHVRSDHHGGLRRLLKGRHPLPLARPEYYEQAYAPVLTIIDDVSHPATSAKQVETVAADLKLSHILRFQQGDFRGMSTSIPADVLPFDFVWFDCGSFPHYSAFLAEYWSLINPRHGLLLLHSTLTNVQLRPIVLDLKLKQATDSFNKFELLSFLEPDKWRQNSVTMIRMLPPEGDTAYTVGP
jgi:predicted O-methyltransferase YrrM